MRGTRHAHLGRARTLNQRAKKEPQEIGGEGLEGTRHAPLCTRSNDDTRQGEDTVDTRTEKELVVLGGHPL